MPRFIVSRAAQSDMRGIARYTFEKWGAAQAVRYIAGLERRFQLLADNEGLGRSCESVNPGLHRHEQGRHVIFYRAMTGGIRIVRLLHQQMIPSKTHFEL